MRPLTQEDMERLLLPLLQPKHRKILDDEGGVDFSYVIGHDECRFRVSLFKQRGRLSLVARRVNNHHPEVQGTRPAARIEKLCNFPEGLVILAGVTGSRQITTIASMLDYINEREPLHILTVEDPIEFTFTDKKAYINQREIGLDVMDWHKALKDAVRQDPDVILVGELRDVETFEAAVHAAETGHLVFGTIHAASAATTINRILDLFPPDKHTRHSPGAGQQPQGGRRPETHQGAQEGPRADQRDHDRQPDRSEADQRGRGQQTSRRHPHRLSGRHGRLHRESAPAGGARRHRQGDGPEVAPNPEQLKMAFKGIKVAAPGIL